MNPEQEVNSENSRDLKTDLSLVLGEISMKMDKLIEKSEAVKKRDGWDKFQIISSFFSTVLLAGVGIIFTLIYNNREKESQIEMQKAQLNASIIQSKSQERVAELQALINLTPLLASADSGVKTKAAIILQALNKSDSTAGTKNDGNLLSSYIALVNTSDVPLEERIKANKKITDIALNPSSTESEQKGAIIAIAQTAASDHAPSELKDAASKSLDVVTQQQLLRLKPEVAELAKKMISLAKADGINLVVIEGYRSPAKQDSLFAQGVTKLKGGQTMHNKGLAFDVGIFLPGGTYDANMQHYKKLGKYVPQLDLTWGGDWRTFQNCQHFELKQK